MCMHNMHEIELIITYKQLVAEIHTVYTVYKALSLLGIHLAVSLFISSFLPLLIVCEGQLKSSVWHSPLVSETWLPKESFALLSSTTPSLGEDRNELERKLQGTDKNCIRWWIWGEGGGGGGHWGQLPHLSVPHQNYLFTLILF